MSARIPGSGHVLRIACLAAAAVTLSLEAPTPAAAQGKASIELGARLVEQLDCNTCHTPKIFGPQGPGLDAERLLAGHPAVLPAVPAGSVGPKAWGGLFNNHMTAWVGPWGVSYATNLTPDADTGIGTWTKETFIAAMRTGKHMGVGRPILPPMPWQAYKALSDTELGAIFDYLQSLGPIENAVPDPTPPDKVLK